MWKEVGYGGMSEKEKQLLVQEVNLLRELRHPHIVRYHDRIIDRDNSTLYIIMEFCEVIQMSCVKIMFTQSAVYTVEPLSNRYPLPFTGTFVITSVVKVQYENDHLGPQSLSFVCYFILGSLFRVLFTRGYSIALESTGR